jgi:predicted kinase/diadenosine tetraphosphatase ApaH/serine/threonine PP2A family protein phosphatase
VKADPALPVPSPSLVLMVGPAGSGKTTFCQRNFPASAVVSSDECRAAVAGDPADQSATPAAFALAHERVEERLRRRRLAVLDATSLTPRARAAAVDLAARHHLPAVAIVLDVPAEVCVRQDAARADRRRVGRRVIGTHATALRAALDSLPREGFRAVHHLRGARQPGSRRVTLEPLPCDRSDDPGPFDIVGDVHGCLDELCRLLERLGYRRRSARGPYAHPRGRRAVFLGDLVDRGPGVIETARLAMAMAEAGTALCVPGNHDADLAAILSGGRPVGPPGPGTTCSLDQIAAAARAGRSFRGGFTEFVAALPSHLLLDGGRLAVAHAGLRAEYIGRDSEHVRRFALFGEQSGDLDRYGLPVRVNWARGYAGRTFVVYGHTPVRRPEAIGNTLNIDTGCVYGGGLTALRWPERTTVTVRAARVYYRSPRTRRLGVGIRARTRSEPTA